jgi:transposase
MMKHSEEFKQEAVRISLTSGLSRERVGKDLGIGKSTLGKWISQYRPADLLAAPQADLARENERLRLENRVLDHVTPRSGSGFRINEVNPVSPTIHSEMKKSPALVRGGLFISAVLERQKRWPNFTPKNCGRIGKFRDEPEQIEIEQKVFVVRMPRRSKAFWMNTSTDHLSFFTPAEKSNETKPAELPSRSFSSVFRSWVAPV